MSCGYYCVTYDCYVGESEESDKLVNSSDVIEYFQAAPSDNFILFNPYTDSITVRRLNAGPFPTRVFAEIVCAPSESASASVSLSASVSESVSISESISESVSESISIPVDCGEIGNLCSYCVEDLFSLQQCCDPENGWDGYSSTFNRVDKVANDIWISVGSGLNSSTSIRLVRILGIIEDGGMEWGTPEGFTYHLTISCEGPFSNTLWEGYAVDDPSNGFTRVRGCDSTETVIMNDCSSESGSASISI